ncbi:collagen alpha-1(X) chain-like [Mytilus edulis]|uniref:collagen alpha-1(X) chain-like n=1 Tax=Mytilus edulis TaxID=6550 RepID=UPI0039F04ECA
MHHPIVFDHVILNIGKGYNKYTGTFTAPVSGIYVFTFTLYPNRYCSIAVNIFKNSEVIAQSYIEMTSGMLSGTTPVAVVDMNVGDTAFVRTSSIHQPHGDIFSNEGVKSSFAGWKIAIAN